MDLVGSNESQQLALMPVPLQQSSQHHHAGAAALPGEPGGAPKLKLGNGGAPMEQAEAREILGLTQGSGSGEARGEKVLKKGTVRYRECQKNHAASIGGHALDGCGEFMAGGEEGTVDALRCAACDCHRNFHRREVEGEVICDCKRNKGRPGGVLLAAAGLGGSSSGAAAGPAPPPTMTTPPSTLLGFPPQGVQVRTAPLLMALSSGAADSDEQEAGTMSGGGSPSAMKKRFRTKFSTEQKEQMHAFADKLGWRMQKHDEAAVQEFCHNVGVKRHVLKVWMHNNKHTLGKKI